MDRAERAEIRAALRAAVAEHGVRVVARQAGMSPSGLTKVIEGSRPWPKTWERLRAWYATAAPELNRTSAETGRAALSLLARGISPELRGTFRAGLAALLVRLYREAGTPAPAWLEQEAGEEQQQEGARFATVELRGAEPVELLEPPFAGQPRMVVEAIGVQRGVWSGNVFYPPHRITRIRLGGEE